MRGTGPTPDLEGDAYEAGHVSWEFLTDDEERFVSWLPGRSGFIVGLQHGGKYSNRMFYTVMEIRGNKAKTHRNLGTYRRARPAPEHEPDFNYDASKDTKIWLNRTAEAVINRMINQT